MSEAVVTERAEPEVAPASDAAKARQHHATYLMMSIFVLLFSFVLQVTSPESVGVQAFGGELRVPPLCLLQSWTGWSCPGCGLTRGLVSLAHGEVTTALAFHPLSPLFLLIALWQLPYRAVMIRRGEWLPPRGLSLLHRWAGYLTIAALMVVWMLRLVTST